VHQHKADDGQIACISKTGPEARHFVDRERNDVEPWFLDAQPAELEPGASQAHWFAMQIDLMEAMRHLTGSIGELIADSTISTGDAIVDGSGRRRRLPARLEAQVIEKRCFGEVGGVDFASMMNALPPTHEV